VSRTYYSDLAAHRAIRFGTEAMEASRNTDQRFSATAGTPRPVPKRAAEQLKLRVAKEAQGETAATRALKAADKFDNWTNDQRKAARQKAQCDEDKRKMRERVTAEKAARMRVIEARIAELEAAKVFLGQRAAASLEAIGESANDRAKAIETVPEGKLTEAHQEVRATFNALEARVVAGAEPENTLGAMFDQQAVETLRSAARKLQLFRTVYDEGATARAELGSNLLSQMISVGAGAEEEEKHEQSDSDTDALRRQMSSLVQTSPRGQNDDDESSGESEEKSDVELEVVEVSSADDNPDQVD